MARKQGGKGRPYVKASEVVLGTSPLRDYNAGQYITVYGRVVRMARTAEKTVLVPGVNHKPMSMAAFRMACGRQPKQVLPVVSS